MQPLPLDWQRHASLASGSVLIALALLAALPGHSNVLAIYALSFWHYGLYWFAYRHGAVAMDVFKRDAVMMKSVSLIALGTAYFATPLDALSLAVVAAGFVLNGVAARALGADRTYYGHELAGLPHQRITAFPYGWVSHPMLVGNMAAFGGTLLNAPFRDAWWPLAVAHIAFNLGLLVMETTVTPLRGGTPGGPGLPAAISSPPRARPLATRLVAILAGAVIGAAPGVVLGRMPEAMVGAATLAHMIVIYFCYKLPPSPSA